MPLTPGTRIGVYEVTGVLGAGGMGEVYRARDTKLNRDVALKMLPDAFAAIPTPRPLPARSAGAGLAQPSAHRGDLRARGQRRHPRAVLELVEGDTLADRIARGPLPVRRGAADRAADRRGARSRARAGHHPPRPEAGQHQGHARRRGEGARLRPGEADGAGRVRPPRTLGLVAVADDYHRRR